MANGQTEQFLTVKEVAHAARVRPDTIWQYIREGRGPRHSKIGRVIRIHIDDFDRWMRQTPKGK